MDTWTHISAFPAAVIHFLQVLLWVMVQEEFVDVRHAQNGISSDRNAFLSGVEAVPISRRTRDAKTVLIFFK